MAASRKQVAFDMDTKALKEYYPKDNWAYSYEIMKRHMTKNGFKWVQGSVYVSIKPIHGDTVSKIIAALIKKHPWLNVCMRDCRQTNIGREHSQNYLFDKDADIPKRDKSIRSEKHSRQL